MGKARSAPAPVSAEAIIDALTSQGIAVHGPFCTHLERVIFVVDKYILLESELLDLLEQNKLNRDGIQELGKRIETRSR
jgi:hypothetical protein